MNKFNELYKHMISKYLIESAKSDNYERELADYLDSMDGVNAERPKVSASYPDVYITLDNGKESWLEVKMSHTDNLGNPRMFFDGKKWATTYTTPIAAYSVNLLNKLPETKKFLNKISKFSGIETPEIPTTKGGLKSVNAVPLDVMKAYFSQPGVNRYIANKTNVDLAKLTTEHYLEGKAVPTYYLQAGDDFYMIGPKNPLDLPKDIPLLSGTGPFRVRIGTRSQFYEVQAEIKIAKMPKSKYSIKPGTKKINPFANIGK